MYNLFLIVITVIIWGTTWIGVKLQIGEVPLMQSVAYRFLLAGLAMQLILLLLGRLRWFTPRHHLLFILLGAMLFCWNYVLVYVSSDTGLTSGLIAVIFSLLITCNILNSAVFFGERPKSNVAIGAVLGLIGISMIFTEDLGLMLEQPQLIWGVGAALASTYLASLGNMVSKSLQRQGVDVTATNGWGMTYGGLMLMGVVLIMPEPLRFDPSPTYVITLILLALLGSLVAFWSYLTLLGRVGASRASYTMILVPLWALGISWWFEGYEWSALKLLGVGVVLLGNLIVSGRLHIRKRSAQPA